MENNSLVARQNELVRFYVSNLGTTIPFPFHLHSPIFKVYQSGLLSNDPIDVQTISISPGDAIIVEAIWKYPGTYFVHSHGIQEERGNMGEIDIIPESRKLSRILQQEQQQQILLQLSQLQIRVYQ